MNEDQVTTDAGSASRRALLFGVGAAGVTSVLAACSDDNSSTPPNNTPLTNAPQTTAPADSGGNSGGNVLAKTTDIPEGGGKIFAAQSVVVTQPAKGQFKAFSSICTHMKCPVGNVSGGTINCDCHGSKYSVTDGSVKNGPATKPLEEKTITVAGGDIKLA
jgi:nitrite reductase/ring-hydroxylating ferredoxin subunit